MSETGYLSDMQPENLEQDHAEARVLAHLIKCFERFNRLGDGDGMHEVLDAIIWLTRAARSPNVRNFGNEFIITHRALLVFAELADTANAH